MSFRNVRRLADVRRRLFLEPLENRQLMAIDLAVALRITEAGQTIEQPGVDITEVNLGDQYQVRGNVQDLRAGGVGVFQAYFDVNHETGAGTAGAATISGAFPVGQETGTPTATSVDLLGGSGNNTATTASQALFLIPFTATTAGVYNFTPELANDQLLFPTALRPNDPVDATELQTTADQIEVLPDTDVIVDPAAVEEDSAMTVVNLTGISGGAGNPTIFVTAEDNALVDLVDLTVVYTSADPTGTLQITPKPDAFGTTTITVSTTVNLAVRTRTFTFTINPVIDSPEIQLPIGGDQRTYVEQAAAILLAPAATVVDADSPANFDGGFLSVATPVNFAAGDVLTVQNQGNGAGQIGFVGANVSYEGNLIGTFAATATGFDITFNTAATPTAVQALVRAITFETPGDNPSPLTRTVALTLDDGTAAAATTTNILVSVDVVNDPPTIAVGGPINYTRGAPAITVDNAGTVADVDSASLDTGSLTVSMFAGGQPEDVLAITNQGNGAGQIGVTGNDVFFEGVQIGTFVGGNGADLVVTFNAASSPAAAQAPVRAITFFNDSVAPNAAKTIRFTINDGDAGNPETAFDDVVVNVMANNLDPVIATHIAVAYTEGDPAVTVDPTATVTDADSADFNTGSLVVSVSVGNDAQDVLEINNEGNGPGQIGVNAGVVSFGGLAIGAFVGGNGLTPLTITFNTAAATPAAVQRLVQNITFRSTSDTPPALKTVKFALTDGDGGADEDETNVNITQVNDAPVVTTAVSVAYTEGDAATIITPAATVTDLDSVDFAGGSLVATVTAGDATDVLEINNVGAGAGQINTNGTDVRVGTTVIGTFAGGNGTPLTITLNAQATPAFVELLLENITYRSSSNNPAVQRTVTFAVTDGDGPGAGATGADFTLVNITGVNDAPVLALLPAVDAQYTENGPPALIAPQSTLVDPDSDFVGGSLVVTITTGGEAADELYVLDDTAATIMEALGEVSFNGVVFATATGGTNNLPLTINFNVNATRAFVEALLRRIAFDHTSDVPGNQVRTVTFAIADGDTGADTETADVQVTPVNDAPVITLLPAAATVFTEAAGAVQIADASTVVDPDSPTFNTGALNVEITANADVADQLSVRNEGVGAGQIGVNGNNVTFGGLVIGTLVGNNTANLTVSFTTANATVAAVEALVRNITFNNTSNNPSEAQRTVRFSVNDDGAVNDFADHLITVNAVNDLPVVTLSPEGVAITAANDTRRISAAPTVADTDSPNFDTGTLTVSITANGTADDRLEFAAPVDVVLNNVNVDGFTIGVITSNGVGLTPLVITFNANATPARVTTLLGNIVYRHANPAAEPDRTVQVVVNDGDGGNSLPVTKQITFTVVPPTVTVPAANIAYTENDPATAVFGGTTVTDDGANLDGGFVSVSIIGNAEAADRLAITPNVDVTINNNTDVLVNGMLIGTVAAAEVTGGAVLTINLNTAATPARVQTLLAAITFRSVSENPSILDRTVRVIVDDGTGGSDSGDRTVEVTAVNDAPVITTAVSVAYTENGPAVTIDPNAVVTDVDAANFNGGLLRVEITAGNEATDFLTINNQGVGVGQIGVNGNNVTFGGAQIGTFVGGDGLNELVITLNAAATPAAVQALARNIAFRSDSNSPPILKIVTFSVNDGFVGGDAADTTDVNITLVNDAPVVTTAVAVAYTEGAPAVIIDPAATLTDADSADFAGGSLVVTVTGGLATDILGINNEGTGAGQINTDGTNVRSGTTVIGTFAGGDGTPLTITLNASATPAVVEALLQNITYRSTSDAPTAQKTVTFAVTDADGPGAGQATGTDFTLVNITAVNDAPVVTLLPVATPTFNEGGTAAVIAAESTVTDADSPDFNGGSLTVKITAGSETTDVLAIRNEGVGAGQINTDGANVRIGTTVLGTFVGGANGADLVITFTTADATPANVQALVRNITFSNTSVRPSNAARTVQFALADGDTGTDTKTKTVSVTAVNSDPVQTLPGGPTAYTENGTAVAIDAGATVTDVDSDFNSGTATLTVTLPNGNEATDLLAIRSDGNAAGQIGVNGATISFGGTAIATFTGGNGTNPLVITFNAAATPAAVQALERAIVYSSSSENPLQTKSVRFVLADGNGGNDTDEKAINVTRVNDPPVQTLSTEAVNYTGTAVAVSATGTVADPDSADFNGGTLTVSFFAGGTADDRLTISNDGTGTGQIGVNGANVTFEGVTIGTFTGGTGTTALVITFNSATATPAAVQALERAIRYSNVGSPATGTRTVRFLLDDGDGGTATDSDDKVINVTAVGALVIVLSTETVTYVENGPAQPIASTSTITDSNSANFNGGTLTVTLTAGGTATDQLEIPNQGTGAGQFGVSGATITFGGTTIGTFSGGTNGTPLVIALNSSATVAVSQSLLRAITFRNSSENPATTARTLSVTLADGTGSTSVAVTKNVNVTAVNDAPVNTVPAAQSTTTNTNRVFSTANGNAISVNDVDVGGSEVLITLSTTNGTLSLSGVTGLTFTTGDGTSDATMTFRGTLTNVNAALNGLSYIPTTGFTGAGVISLVTSDQGATGTGGTLTDTDTVTVNVASTGTPVVTLSSEAVTYTENGAGSVIAATSTITDSDSTNFNGGTLTVTITAGGSADDRLEIPNQGTAAGQFGVSGATITFGGVTIGTFAGGTGTTPLVITLNSAATVEITQSLLRALTFRTVSEIPSTTTRTLSVALADGTGRTSPAATKNVTVVSINDAPVNTVPGVQNTAVGTNIVFNAANGNQITVNDVDLGSAEITVSLIVTNGTLTLSGISGLTFTSGDGTSDASMVFRGSVANVNTALNGLTFTPTAGFNGDAVLTVVSNDQGATGNGGALTDTDTVTVKVGNANFNGGVFVDTNNDGIRNNGELGIPNVIVTITGADAATAGITRTVTTGADGTFAVSGLTPGQYRVVQTQPANFLDGITTPPAGGTVDANGVLVTITSGQVLTGPSFGELGFIPSKITLEMFLASTPSDQTLINERAPGGAKALNLAGGAVNGGNVTWLAMPSAQKAVQQVANNLLSAAGRITAAASSPSVRTTSATNPVGTWSNATRARTTSSAPTRTLAQLQDALSKIEVRMADLPEGRLAETVGNVITFDVNAAGQGWFVDPTPSDNEEFFAQYGQLSAAAGSAAAGKVDLLTVAAHELGHVLGLDDLYAAHDDGDVMSDDLVPGVRKEIGDDLIRALLGE